MSEDQGDPKRAKTGAAPRPATPAGWEGASREGIVQCLLKYDAVYDHINVPAAFVTPTAAAAPVEDTKAAAVAAAEAEAAAWPLASFPLGAGAEYIVHANHMIQLEAAGATFSPEFSHQYFALGEDGELPEVCLGYLNPSISIRLTPTCRFYVGARADHRLPQFDEGEAGEGKEGSSGGSGSGSSGSGGSSSSSSGGGGGGEDEDGDQREEGEDEGEVDEDARADDEAFEGLLSNPVASGIEQSLLRRVRLGLAPPSFCTRDAAAYASWLAEDQVAAPVGKRIGAPWSVQRAGEAGGEGGGGKDMFELYRGDTSDVLVQEMLARLTAVAMWYINGASLVDVTDPKVGGGG